MGCFSWKCKVCNKPINSTSFSGEGVKIFLLQDGEVLEEMQGDYNSYGSVFDLPEDSKSERGENDWTNDWSKIVNMCCGTNPKNGIAAIHTDCWKGEIPTTESEDDEDQGWGKIKRKSVKETYHKFYKLIK